MGRIIAKRLKGMNWMAKVSLILTCTVFLSIFLFAPDEAQAAARVASVTGVWSNTATWGGLSVPVAADTVTINNGIAVTVDVAAAACTSVALNGGALATSITISGTNSLTVSGAVSTGAQTAATVNQIAVATGTLTAGSITITGGTFAGGISRVTVSTGTVTVNGALTFGAGTTVANQVFSFSGAGTLNISGNVVGTVGTFTTFAGSTVNFNGAAQILAPFAITFNNLTLSGSGVKTMTNASVSGILSMEGTATASAAPTWSGAAYTLQYKGTAAQTTGPEFTTPFAGTGGVKIENASGVTLNAAKSVGANPLTIGGTVANSLFNDGGFQLTATGTLNLTSGTFKLGSAGTATTFPLFATRNISAGTTVEYASGLAQTVAVIAYPNLTLSGGGAKTGAVTTVGGNLTLSGTVTYTTAAALVITGNVNIGNGTTLTVGAFNITVTGTTTVGGGTSGILAHSGAGTRTYTGAVTIASGGQWTNAGGSATTFGGSLTNNGSFNSGAGIQTFNGASAILTHSGTAFTAGAGSFTMSGTTQQIVCDATHGFTIPTLTSTAVTNNCTGGLTVSTALAGTLFTQGTNAVLIYSPAVVPAVTTLTATAAGNTVNYSGAAQTGKVTTYVNLTLSGTLAKTFATAPTVNGILSMEGTATISIVPTYGAAATLQYNKPAAFTSGVEWLTPFVATGGVIIANTGAITMNAAKVFANSVPLTINIGATLITNSLALTLGGNFVNNGGTFTAGTSTVTFNGTGTQSISGSNTWYGLSITAAAARTVKFASGATQTIAAGGSLTLTGAAGNLLTLAPSGATAWLLNKNAAITPTISNVSVSFSNASSGGLIDASTGANNSNAGNNTNWKFSATITSCVGCHGYKATFGDGTARNTPDGAFLGSHNEHVVTYSMVCSVCHVAPAGETSADFDHRNSNIQMAIPINAQTDAAYTKGTSWAQINPPGAFTACTNLYCHSQGTSATSNTGDTRAIFATPLTSLNWAGTGVCSSCHGNPPSYTNGATTWGAAKGNSHASHTAYTCDKCHNTTTTTGNTITTPANHVNKLYTVVQGTGVTFTSYTYDVAGGTCATISCHGNTNAQWGVPDCITCHSVAIGTRRAIKPEFGMAWSHKRTASTSATYPTAAFVVNKYDCCVCHLEGTSGTTLTTFHSNGVIDLRNPDTGDGTGLTAFAVFGRDVTKTIPADTTYGTIATNVQNNLCLKCHDSETSNPGNGGAKSSLAWVPGGSALRPFGTAPTHTPGLNVLDVYAQFATTNASFHPVKGVQNNNYCDVDTMEIPWNVSTGTHKLISCWDCHPALNTAHGAAVTLRDLYDAPATPSDATGQTKLCVVCHKKAVYWSTSVHALLDIGAESKGPGFSALNWIATDDDWNAYHDTAQGEFHGCTVCHGTTTAAGALPARPIKAENAHGFDKLTSGANWPTGTRPYSFMRNNSTLSGTAATSGWSIGSCDGTTTAKTMCGSGYTYTYSPGGTY